MKRQQPATLEDAATLGSGGDGLGRDIEDWFEAEREFMDQEDEAVSVPRHSVGDDSDLA